MDKITKYQKMILEIIEEYAKIKYANVDGENYVVADKENHRYLVMTIGWEDGRFVHDCPMHFDIKDGKIWLQRNQTEWMFEEWFDKYGITKDEVVLGFLSPKMREYSDFAIA